MMLFTHETDQYGNPISHCPSGQKEQADGSCADDPSFIGLSVNVTTTEQDVGEGKGWTPWQECESNADCSYPQTCDNGACTEDAITCWDGSIQPSLADCPDPAYDWQTPKEWMEGDDWAEVLPDWYDKPGGEDEWNKYLYEEVAGGAETGFTQQEFIDQYGDLFPRWEESYEFQKFTNILQQMGLEEKGKENLWEKWQADKEAESLKTMATIESYTGKFGVLPYEAESQFVLAGGGVSGRNIAKMKTVSQDLSIAESMELEGIQMDVDALTLAYKVQVEDVEDQQLKLENTLLDIQQDYADNLEALYEPDTMKDFCPDPKAENGGCPDGEVCDGLVCVPDTGGVDGDGDNLPVDYNWETYFTEDEEGARILKEDVVKCSCVDRPQSTMQDMKCTIYDGNSKRNIEGNTAVKDWFDTFGAETPSCASMGGCTDVDDCPACEDRDLSAACVSGRCECAPKAGIQ